MSDQKQTEDSSTEPSPEARDEAAGAAEPASGQGGEADAAVDFVELAEKLAAAEAEVAALKDQHLRALAEIENVRKRAARDREDAGRYAVSSFARDILSVADSLRRALETVDTDARAADPALEALVAGVEMTDKQLLSVFERHGITPIAAAGQRFDPHVHDAMFEVPDESVPAGTVVQVVEAGFMIHERPLRPARVGVSRGGPKAETAAAASQDPVTPFPGGPRSAYERQSDSASDASGSKIDEKL